MWKEYFKKMEIFNILSILGEPFYKSEKCLLYCMDSTKAMNYLLNPATKEDSVKRQKRDQILFDCTITSPPYNIGKEYEKELSVQEYVTWCNNWIKQIYQLTKSEGTFWLNVGYTSVPRKGRAIPIPYLLWDKVPFYLNQEVVWNYGAGVACKNYFSPRNEKILWYVKDSTKYTFNLDPIRDLEVKYPNQKKNGKLRCNPLGKNPTDVWQIPKITSGRSCDERTPHPAQFPEELVRRLLLCSTNKGNLVLDPFMGSGTTAKVCLEQNRLFVGFEISEKYCHIARNRIEHL